MDDREPHRPGDSDQPLPAGPCPAVMAGLGGLSSVLTGLAGAPMWSLTDAQAAEAVKVSFGLIQRLQAVHLAAVAELDARPSAIPGAAPETAARTFLVHAVNWALGAAGGDVRAALAIRADADPATGGLPRPQGPAPAPDQSRSRRLGRRPRPRYSRRVRAGAVPG